MINASPTSTFTIPELASYDDYFINSAYLSELWAAEDLKKRLAQGFGPKGLLEDQIEDELRHAHMLRRSMENAGHQIIDSMQFAMQNVIHFQVGKIQQSELDANPELFWGFHDVMERRAVWNYRTSIVGGIRTVYAGVLNKIIEDEKSHLVDRPINADHPLVTSWRKADRWVFRKHIQQYYNNLDLLRSRDFWCDYFGPGLKSS